MMLVGNGAQESLCLCGPGLTVTRFRCPIACDRPICRKNRICIFRSQQIPAQASQPKKLAIFMGQEVAKYRFVGYRFSGHLTGDARLQTEFYRIS